MSNRTVNRVTLIGVVGRDPEILFPKDAEQYARTSLSTDRKIEDDPKHGINDWHTLVFLGRTAPYAANHLAAGDRIYVEGEIRYEVHEDGPTTWPTVEIHVRTVVKMTPGADEPGSAQR